MPPGRRGQLETGYGRRGGAGEAGVRGAGGEAKPFTSLSAFVGFCGVAIPAGAQISFPGSRGRGRESGETLSLSGGERHT